MIGESMPTLVTAQTSRSLPIGEYVIIDSPEGKIIGLAEKSIPYFVDILQKLSKLTVEKEAELTEINPLVILKDGSMLALDGKIMTDDNSNFRHEELMKYREQTELEAKAEKRGFSLVELDLSLIHI